MPDKTIIVSEPRAWTLRLDFSHMMADSVGEEHGIAEREITQAAPRVEELAEEVAEERGRGKLPFAELPYQKQSLREVQEAANALRPKFDNLVVCGIGGSALGMIALQTALRHPYHNLLPEESRGAPRVFVTDNIDPAQVSDLMGVLAPERTLVTVITKSGATAETMAQYLIFRDWLEAALGADHKDHVVCITDARNGALRRLADRERYRSFVVPDGVGGRFSVLSPVGLFPAAVAGINVRQLLAGAAAMDARCATTDVWDNPAYMSALLHYLADTRKGKPMAVMMPYAHALKDVADWFRQLWAESLGKRAALDGSVVHCGPTPVRALGVTDQHSQIQLYVEGPFDKTVTFLAVEEFRATVPIPAGMEEKKGVGYLCGHTLNELLAAEMRGTRVALTEAQRPNMTITMHAATPHTLGQLLYMLEMQTVMAGKLYGINAFDQPGVEAGKEAAFALLGRQGYEARREQIEAALPLSTRYQM